MSLNIAYSRRALHTPAFALLAEGWNEIVQEGMSPELVGVSPVAPDDEVFHAVSADGDIVGVLSWSAPTNSGVFKITIAYVEPTSRRKGVFKALMNALREIATQDKIVRITTEIAPMNAIAKAAFGQVGLKPSTVVYDQYM